MTVTPTPVILDVDTGVDDACALMLAALHPGLELVAVTCVGGNAGLAHVVANTLTVLEVCGAQQVPVAAGAPRPLLADPVDARHVHGQDGLGDLPLPRSGREPQAGHAVELLRDALMAAERPVTVVPLGPLTNIALLLRTYPQVAAGIERIVFMGGSVGFGNATASAEFNVFHDPEAAAITLDACAELGLDVTMYGLDVFYGPRVARDQVTDLLDAPIDRPAGLAARLIGFQCDRFGADDATIGDAGAVATVLDPSLVRTDRRPVRVELAGAWSRGRTVVDGRDWNGDRDHDPQRQPRPPIDVAVGIDGGAAARVWLETVSAHR